MAYLYICRKKETMDGLFEGDVLNWIIMILVGALSGSLAARIIKGDSFGFVINALLGIAGALSLIHI